MFCYQLINTVDQLHKIGWKIIINSYALLHKGPVLCDNPEAPIIKPINQPEPYKHSECKEHASR